MKRAYRIIAVMIVIGAIAQIIEGFAEFFSRLDEILATNIRPTNPTSIEMFGRGLLGIASAAPTLLIAAIFYHMDRLLAAICRTDQSVELQEHKDEAN